MQRQLSPSPSVRHVTLKGNIGDWSTKLRKMSMSKIIEITKCATIVRYVRYTVFFFFTVKTTNINSNQVEECRNNVAIFNKIIRHLSLQLSLRISKYFNTIFQKPKYS